MMQIREATNRNDLKQIKQLYLSAFPKEERPPFSLLCHKAKQNKGTFLLLEDNQYFIGFMHVAKSNSLVYLAFFAIDNQYRGKGYGSQALALLKKNYQDIPILIAREILDPSCDNYVQREQRYHFYLNNGFVDLPYSIQEGNVIYDSMSTHPSVKPEQYMDIAHRWAGPIVSKLIGFQMQKK